MADEKIKISELDVASQSEFTDNALLALDVEDQNSETGYSTKSGLLSRLIAYIKTKLGIEDLKNVNITTSDNNKLLGVSVTNNVISVGAVTPSSLFTSYSEVLQFSNTKTVYVDVNIDKSKIILQGAILSADAAVPLICSIQSLGANSTRIRVNALQNYTSYLTLYYLAIN